MNSAIAEFPIMQISLLCTLTSQLGYASHSLTFVFTLSNFILKHVGHIFFMNVQKVINLALNKVTNILVYGFTAWLHQRRTELNLGLRLKDWLFNVNGYSRNDTISNICKFVVFVEKLLNCTRNMLFKSTLMRSALRSMLTIHKAMVLFTILIGMSEGNLDIFSFDMNDRIKWVNSHVVNQQILQTIATLDTASIIHNGEPRVKIGIVSQHRFHVFIVEFIILK